MSAKTVTRTEYHKLVKKVAAALALASVHDPEHENRLSVLERQMERIGAPQYRIVRKGKR